MEGMELRIVMIFGVLIMSSAIDSGGVFSGLMANNPARTSFKLALHGNVYPDGYAILIFTLICLS